MVAFQLERKWQLKSVTAAFYSRRFYEYFLMMFFSNIFITLFSYLYKPVGLGSNISDRLLTLAGSCGALT